MKPASLQPIEQFAELARAAGVPLHTDAAQAAGKSPVDFRRLGVAALSSRLTSFTARAVSGLCLLRGEVSLEPQLWGGFHQEGLRPGTECVALAVGMHVALSQLSAGTIGCAANESRGCATASKRRFAAAGRMSVDDNGPIGRAIAEHFESLVSGPRPPGVLMASGHGRHRLFDRFGLRQRLARTIADALGDGSARAAGASSLRFSSGATDDRGGNRRCRGAHFERFAGLRRAAMNGPGDTDFDG